MGHTKQSLIVDCWLKTPGGSEVDCERDVEVEESVHPDYGNCFQYNQKPERNVESVNMVLYLSNHNIPAAQAKSR